MPREVVEKPVRGILSYDQGPREYYARGVMVARLLDPEDRKVDMIPPIDHAKIERARDFIQVRGTEYHKKSVKSRVDRWEQSWICCLHEDDGMRLMLAAERRRRAGVPLDRWPSQISAALAEAAARAAIAQRQRDIELSARIAALQAEEDEQLKEWSPAVVAKV